MPTTTMELNEDDYLEFNVYQASGLTEELLSFGRRNIVTVSKIGNL